MDREAAAQHRVAPAAVMPAYPGAVPAPPMGMPYRVQGVQGMQQMYFPPAQQPLYPGMAQYPHAPPAAEPPAEDESSRSKVFPVHGNTTNFNINSLLYNNILQSDYFKALYQLRTYHETIGAYYAWLLLVCSPLRLLIVVFYACR